WMLRMIAFAPKKTNLRRAAQLLEGVLLSRIRKILPKIPSAKDSSSLRKTILGHPADSLGAIAEEVAQRSKNVK
ncbi:hypothetical protein, partial [Actinotignum sanguinis]|uniref:hypothetical protein n=1 Tax=Actinotignum sanguinis TaxID=1445614 RepID=UPI002A80BCAC